MALTLLFLSLTATPISYHLSRNRGILPLGVDEGQPSKGYSQLEITSAMIEKNLAWSK